MKGRFHPEYPDDLQILVHDGGPRFSDRRPEVVWVRVNGGKEAIFSGEVLNAPQHLQTVRQAQQVKFVVAGIQFPLLLSDKYLAERPLWRIQPCQGCGLSELFDAPSDLIRKAFPALPEGGIMASFTSKCPVCNGVMVIESVHAPGAANDGVSELPAPVILPQAASIKKAWWEFWK